MKDIHNCSLLQNGISASVLFKKSWNKYRLSEHVAFEAISNKLINWLVACKFEQATSHFLRHFSPWNDAGNFASTCRCWVPKQGSTVTTSLELLPALSDLIVMIFERPKTNVCPETGVNDWIERIPFLPKKSDFQDIVSTFWLDLMTAGRAGVQRRTGAKVISLLFRRESHRGFCGCWAALLLDSSGNTKKSLWEKRRDCRSNMQLFENLWTCNELRVRVSLLSSIFFFQMTARFGQPEHFPEVRTTVKASGLQFEVWDLDHNTRLMAVFFAWNSGCWMNQLFDTQNIPKWSWMLDEELFFLVFTIQNDWNSLDHHPSRGDFLNSWIGAQSLGLTGREMWWSNK